MSQAITVQTEIEKLSFILKQPAETLSFLKTNELADIQFIRQSIHDRLLLDNSDVWSKLAAVAIFMPNFINAQVAKTILGANITANFTYHVDISQALAIAKHFSTEFLSEVAENLIPERAEKIIQAFPIADLKRISKHMLAQKKYFTMGAFVDHLPHGTLHILAKEIQDEESLLRIALYTEKKDHLAGLLSGFTDDQVVRLVSKANELKLWPEIIAIIAHFNETEQKRIAELAGRFSDEEIIAMMTEAHRLELLDHVVNFMRFLPEATEQKLAQIISGFDNNVILGLLKSADRLHELALILRIIRFASADDMPQLAALADELTDTEIMAIVHTAEQHKIIAHMLKLAEFFSEDANKRFCHLLDQITENLLKQIIETAYAERKMVMLLHILEYAEESQMRRLADFSDTLNDDILLDILKEASFQENEVRLSVLNLAAQANENTKLRFRKLMQSLPADIRTEAEKVARNSNVYERVKFLF